MIKFEPAYSRRKIGGQATWFVVWLALSVASLELKPDPHGHGTHMQLGLPPCPSVLMFHRPCPGCGLTTSFAHMLRGEFVEAFNCHAFGPLIYLGFTATALMAGYGFVKKLRMDTGGRAFNWMLCAFIVLFFAYGCWRFANVDYGNFPPNWNVASRR